MNESLRIVAVPGPVAEADETGRSFEEFFERERSDLFDVLWMVTRNRFEAEELAQEAFVRVLERWDRVGRMDEPRAYLYRTAMNAFRSTYRRSILAAKRTLHLAPSDDGIAEIDARDRAVRALSTLSSRQRAAVVLVDLLGFPSEQAARMLGVRASTVRVHVSRAHVTLKETMTDE